MGFQLSCDGFPPLRKLEMITKCHHLLNLGGNTWGFVMLFFVLLCSSLIKKKKTRRWSAQ